MKTLLGLLAVVAMLTSAPTPVETAFRDGETLDYTVTWMKVAGGTARMTIAPADDEKSRFRITSVARSGGSVGRLFKVRDEIETTVDAKDFSTLRIRKKLDERGDRTEETTTFEDGVATRKRTATRRVPVPRPVLDPISVIYHIRTLDLAPGKSYEFPLYADLKLYNVRAKVIRREVVQTPAGTFNCLLIEPEMVRGGVAREERLFIWYSDDERRLPVRIRTEVKFGSVTATLKSVSSGVTSTEPPLLNTAVR
ncbi:MAG TPA: DUF3108 domain-containing protein [Thermoanaerobaculia bacterium]